MKFSAALSLLLAAAPVAPVSAVHGVPCDGVMVNDTTTQLDFFASTLDVNTLHLPGGELRYGNIGQVENIDVDLKIIALPNNAHPWPYHNIADVWTARNKTIINGVQGHFGRINLQALGNTTDSGLGNFRYCIVEHGTDNELAPYEFQFTIYDEDQRGNTNDGNGIGLHERMFFNVAQAQSYQIWPNLGATEIDLFCEDPNMAYPCPAGMRTVFHSSTQGGLSDNPTDPNNLTSQQKSRSVAFTFQNRACFELSYELYCPVDEFPDDWPSPNYYCKNSGDGGGNFLFSGAANEMIHEGHCITAAPQPATTSPTDVPSVSPTDAPTGQPSSHFPSMVPSQKPTQGPTGPPNTTPGGSCSVDPESTNQNMGTLNLCLRTSLGYTYDNGVDPVTFQEVNFIETLIRVEYDLTSGFCVDAFAVGPKERELTTVSESYDDALLAYLCIASQHPEFVAAEHLEVVTLSDGTTTDTRPKPLTDYNVDGGTKKFNQGALINVCVRVKDEYILEGLQLDGLTSFSWVRAGGTTYDQDVGGGGDADDTINQNAIVGSSPAGNFLTSYVDASCKSVTNCDFASILFAQFYNTDGAVSGSGDALLKFARRRRLGGEDGRRLQDQDDPGSTSMDITIDVLAPQDGPGNLRTAGGSSPATALAMVVAFAGAVLMA